MKRVPLFLLIIMLLIMAACQPAPTPEPTATAEAPTQAPPTETPTQPAPSATPTLAPVPGDPAVALGVPDGVETFDTANNWQQFNNTCFQNVIQNGVMDMTANGLQGMSCWTVSWPLVQDYYLESLVTTPQTCQPADRFGLFFRAPDNLRGYLFGLSCDGLYSLNAWNGSATTVIVPPAANPAINLGAGSVNRIGVIAYGGTLQLYANGLLLTVAQDTTYTGPGKIGYFVSASSEQPFTTTYDNMSIWLLTDQYYPPNGVTPPPTQPLPPPADGAPTVTASAYVNIRTGPSTAYPVLFTAAPGATGEAVGVSQDFAWYAVRLPTTVSGNGIGWVSGDFVTTQNTQNLPVLVPPAPPPTVPPVPPPSGSATVTNTQPLNVRSGPSTSFPSFGVAPIGSTAAVLGVAENGWYAISIPTTISANGTGWVSPDYVILNNPSNVTFPVLPTPPLPPSVTPPAPDPALPIATAIDPLNVRSGPGNAFPTFGVVPIGSTAQAIGISPDGRWYVVAVPTSVTASGQGWVTGNAVSISPVGAQLPVIQPPPLP